MINNIMQKQFVTFILIGGLNTLVGFFIYGVFIFLNFSYELASLFSTCIGILFNFKSTGKTVFNHHDNKGFLRFCSIYIFIYYLNLQLIKLVQFYTTNLYLAGFILIVPSAILSFILNKYFVFKCLDNKQ